MRRAWHSLAAVLPMAAALACGSRVPESFQAEVANCFPQQARGEVRYLYQMEYFADPTLSAAEREARVAQDIQSLTPSAAQATHVLEYLRQRTLGGAVPGTELRIRLDGPRRRFDLDAPWNANWHLAADEDSSFQNSYFLPPEHTSHCTPNPLPWTGSVERRAAGMTLSLLAARAWFDCFPSESLLRQLEPMTWEREEENSGVTWFLHGPIGEDRYHFQIIPEISRSIPLLTDASFGTRTASSAGVKAPGTYISLSDYVPAWDGFIPSRMDWEMWNQARGAAGQTFCAQRISLTLTACFNSDEHFQDVFHDLVGPFSVIDTSFNRDASVSYRFDPNWTGEEWERHAHHRYLLQRTVMFVFRRGVMRVLLWTLAGVASLWLVTFLFTRFRRAA
jgi:hypothetical protein